MNVPPIGPQRRSLRSPAFDYATPGAYFVTVVAHDRRVLFGDVVDGVFETNMAGQMLDEIWRRLAEKFNVVDLDEFVVMPNHIHGIIWLAVNDVVGAAPCGRPARSPVTLSTILDWYKTMTTNAYIRGVRRDGWPPFSKHVWQRGYYDHVIRDDDDLNRIRQYVIDNPWAWSEDEENPVAAR